MRFKLFLLVATVLTVTNPSARAADTARVLFIGNSFTGVNDLPEVFRLLAASMGDVVIKQSNTPGGHTLMGHSTNAQTLALIDAGGWDFVVLQEQSQRPAFPDAQFQQDVVPYAQTLSQRVRQFNPCARIVFYNTWGYKNGDAGNCPNFPPLCTYRGMDSMLRLRYRILSDSNNAIHCPVGPLWRYIRANGQAIELYDADQIHPSMAGTYAAACAFYAVVFGKSPATASYVPAGLQAPNAVFIRQFAHTVAFDSLSYWRQHAAPLPVPTASFTRVVSGLTVSFASTSTGAASYRWSFGNGATSTAQNPTYTYPAAGIYNVKLIAKSNCGVADSVTQSVTVGVTKVADLSPFAGATLLPNPTRDVVLLAGVPAGTHVSVTDATGRVVMRAVIDRWGEIELTPLAPGTYWLRAQTAGGQRIWPLVRL